MNDNALTSQELMKIKERDDLVRELEQTRARLNVAISELARAVTLLEQMGAPEWEYIEHTHARRIVRRGPWESAL